MHHPCGAVELSVRTTPVGLNFVTMVLGSAVAVGSRGAVRGRVPQDAALGRGIGRTGSTDAT